MADASPGFLAVGQAGVAGHEAQRFHFLRPFLVVWIASGWRTAVVLPVVGHFMNEGGEHRFNGAQGKKSGVQSKFGKLLAVVGDKAVGMVIAIHPAGGAERNQAARQFILEKMSIEVVEGGLQAGVESKCGAGHGAAPMVVVGYPPYFV